MKETTLTQSPSPTAGTPTLDEIAAHGNRGHHYRHNNVIICADGTELSVIAGGGTYSSPRPQYCYTDLRTGDHITSSVGEEVACDYPGPYSHVEVMTHDPELMALAGIGDEDGVGVVSVLKLRDYILKHGGERPTGKENHEGNSAIRIALARKNES